MRKNIIYFLLVLLIGVFLGISFIYFVKTKKSYVAVFLENGNIYFGKLSTFPRLKLNNAIFLQLDQTNQVSLQKFREAFWMPKGPIYLNKDHILFIAPINESSPIINLIEDKSTLKSPLFELPPTSSPTATTTQ